MIKNILRIDASMRKTGSHSRKLTDKLINQIRKSSEGEIAIRDLADGVPIVDERWIGANFTDASKRSNEQNSRLLESDILVNELENADIIVIGLPIYNFGVPAAFKAWIDQIARVKRTFQYTENGPVGLLKDKKAYIIVASGGTKLDSALDFISGYLKHIFGFIGIEDLTIIDSSGLGRGEDEVLSRSREMIEQV